MPTSQNLRFVGDAAPDAEFGHPAGASIARLLKIGLAGRGWDSSEIENWRDSGWSISCKRDASMLEVSLAQLTDNRHWMLQIAPAAVPGVIGRLFGRSPSAQPTAVLDLALQVHAVLTELGQFCGFNWCWDDYPDEHNSTSEPSQPPEAHRLK
jgi:hypothetical protein